MKKGDIIQLIITNSYYIKYENCFGIVLNIYLTDEGKEIADIRLFILQTGVYGDVYITHQNEKAYTSRLKMIS